MRTTLLLLVTISILLVASVATAGGGHDHGDHHGHGHGEEEETPKGKHGGRLLSQDNFSLEMTLSEKAGSALFRVYPMLDDNPVNPSQVQVSIVLTRFGGEEEQFELSAENDYLTSNKNVDELHSFEVQVSALYESKKYSWHYDSFEGRTELSDNALKVAKLGIETSGAAPVSTIAHVYGKLLANEDRVAHITPRFPGLVREIKKQLGDEVGKGEILAIIESNQSLQPYEVKSQVAGVVTKRHATVGEYVSEGREIFVVADLSEVWADFQVYRDDFDQFKPGQKILVELGNDREFEATVKYISPLTDETTQSKLVRAVLPNPSGSLRPGLFITGTLSGSEAAVPVAVKREAIQTFKDWNVVFVTDGHTFQAVPVELGRRDKHHVEILSGLKAGVRYVSRNSFIVKADIEKSGAGHDH